jgi:hypothetical protein
MDWERGITDGEVAKFVKRQRKTFRQLVKAGRTVKKDTYTWSQFFR